MRKHFFIDPENLSVIAPGKAQLGNPYSLAKYNDSMPSPFQTT
jgi:hypothetical protein